MSTHPLQSSYRTFRAASLFIAAGVSGVAWAESAPAPIRCQITAVPLQFESIDPLRSSPQSGLGHVLVTCSNTSEQMQEVELVVHNRKNTDHQLAHEQHQRAAVTLSLFVDAERQRQLASAPDAPQILRQSVVIPPHSNTQHALPVFAHVQLNGLMPAGAYSSPIELELVYKVRAASPAASLNVLNTATLADLSARN